MSWCHVWPGASATVESRIKGGKDTFFLFAFYPCTMPFNFGHFRLSRQWIKLLGTKHSGGGSRYRKIKKSGVHHRFFWAAQCKKWGVLPPECIRMLPIPILSSSVFSFFPYISIITKIQKSTRCYYFLLPPFSKTEPPSFFLPVLLPTTVSHTAKLLEGGGATGEGPHFCHFRVPFLFFSSPLSSGGRNT